MDFQNKPLYDTNFEAIGNHIEKYFNDAVTTVFHEIPVLDIRLDVYHIKPKDTEYEILLSSGMSAMAMNVSEIPNEPEAYAFAEVMTLIPAGLDFGKIHPSGTLYDWIVSMVKQVGKFPHMYDTWIGVGHTIQAEAELLPYSEHTDFCGCIVLPSVTLPEDFQSIQTDHGLINIYSLFPLHKKEIEFKIENGYNAFLQHLIDANSNEVIDFERVSFF